MPREEILAKLATLRKWNPTLRWLMKGGSVPTSNRYIEMNWSGKPPEVLESDEAEVVELLDAYHPPLTNNSE
jgi:hypothetical protein